MARVRLEQLTKRFGNVFGVRDLTLTIDHGEFLVLLGPSGCGKTTTMRMIAGLEEPTSGGIWFDDWDVTDTPPDRRNVAMVFQSLALYPHMTVFDNVAFCLRNQRKAAADISARVRQALAMVNIGELAERLPAQLSGGQQQRVAIARALVREPRVFLLDEPLSALDAKIRQQMRTELKLLHQRLQSTFVYVTHDQVEAMSLGTKVAVMRDGVVEQVAAPRDLYARPVNQFVATFIGNPPMNLLPGELTPTGAGPAFRAGDFLLDLGAHFQAAGPWAGAPTPVNLGIRPEHLGIAAAGDGGVLRGTVLSVEMLGWINQIDIRVGNLHWACLEAAAYAADPGQEVGLTLPLGQQLVHLFHRDTGVCIGRA